MWDEVTRELASVTDRGKMRKYWDNMKGVRRRVWSVRHPVTQKKIEHLTKKAKNCAKHKDCRKLDKLRIERMKVWLDAVSSNQCGDKLVEDACCKQMDGLMGKVGVGLTGTHLHSAYRTKQQDLLELKEEEEQVVNVAKLYNREWKTRNHAHDGATVFCVQS